MFREYIGKLKGIVGEERANFILANAVALVVSGSDDIANTYFTTRVRQLHYDVPSYTDLMANSASDFIQVYTEKRRSRTIKYAQFMKRERMVDG